MEDNFDRIEKDVLAGKTNSSEEHKDLDHFLKGIQSHFEKEELFQKMNTVHEDLESHNKNFKIFQLNNIMKLAASILLIAVVGLILRNEVQRPSSDLFAQHYVTYPNLMLTRSDNSNSLIQQAGLAYSLKDYEKAYSILVQLDDPIASFYSGICLMEMGKYTEAEIAWLDHLAHHTYLKSLSTYQLGLTYIALKDFSAAYETLAKIEDAEVMNTDIESLKGKVQRLINK